MATPGLTISHRMTLFTFNDVGINRSSYFHRCFVLDSHVGMREHRVMAYIELYLDVGSSFIIPFSATQDFAHTHNIYTLLYTMAQISI